MRTKWKVVGIEYTTRPNIATPLYVVTLVPATAADGGTENAGFAALMPFGEVRMELTNPTAAKPFIDRLGKFFYAEWTGQVI